MTFFRNKYEIVKHFIAGFFINVNLVGLKTLDYFLKKEKNKIKLIVFKEYCF